ncbi:PRTRC system protein C [Ralstonia pseudosolanacearum]|uniref:PRTRC system protein C n=1 Tax=Ralstonia pseudosolanacearum TaxID=1310165 RepID=UPI001F32D6DB
MMQAIQLTREFRYSGVRLADPSPRFTLEQVRDFYANTYPEILNADIDGPSVEGTLQVYGFRRAVGRKGSDLAVLRDQIETGSLYAKGRKSITTSQLNKPAANALLKACRPHRDHRTAHGTMLLPPAASLQVLA